MFSDELQALLDKHPEVEEVKVKYKKAGTTFKPRQGVDLSKIPFHQDIKPVISGVPLLSSDQEIAAEMIRKGELTS